MRVPLSLMSCTLILAILDPAVAETVPESEKTSPAPRSILLAQARSGQPQEDINIFEHINIDLRDLQKLGDEVSNRLVGERVRMSLEECVRLALQANHDIQIVHFETALSDADYKSARGVFDPTLSASFQHTDQTSPPSPLQSVFGGLTGTVETRVTRYQLQFGGLLPRWGTQYDTSYQVGRESGTFSPLATYDGALTSTITQPILRGRGTAVNRIQIDTAANGQNIAKYEIQRTALVTIGETIKAYWDLVGAIKNLEVRQQSLDNAMRLVGINEKRLEIGTAAAIEVLQAKAQAATRHSDLITARTSILDTEDVLKNFINLNDNDVFSTTSIIPTTSPGVVGHQWDLDQSITTALNNRPEIRTAELQIENARLSKKGTKNDLLPSLDASVSYGQAARELTAGELRNGIREKQGRTWTFGLQGSIPIGNRAAKGAHMRSEQFERQQELRLSKAQRDVMLDVRMGIRGVVTTEILVESDKQARILQEANVAAEEKRLNLGVTTSQDVLDRQEDLTLAQTQELQSVVNYEKALIQLQVAEGTLLNNLDINWEVEE